MESKRLLVKAYSIPHNLEVNELIEDCMRIYLGRFMELLLPII
ncbi:MAG: hypothetical protein QXN53_06405 [Thermoproteota archaeon]